MAAKAAKKKTGNAAKLPRRQEPGAMSKTALDELKALRVELRGNLAANLLARIDSRPDAPSKPQLAELAGLPQMAVYRAYAGETDPKLSTIVLLARYLRCSVDALIKPPPAPKPKAK